MFGEALKEWEDDLILKSEKRGEKRGKKEGKKEGKKLGKELGIAEGEANVISAMKRALLQTLGERFKPISRAIRKKLQSVNENASLFELIASVNVVKDLQEFDALLDSKLPSHE